MARKRGPTRPLRSDERELWRRFARGVRPLNEARVKRLESLEDPSDAPPRASPQTGPVKTGAAARDPAPPRSTAPADRSAEKRVRRGRVEVEGRIDLHGMTCASARPALLGFLGRARRDGKKTVLVITGKGAGARALDERRFKPWNPDERGLPGVLRRSFTGWMRDPDFAQLVSGYAEASRKHGGSGAFYVMLRGR